MESQPAVLLRQEESKPVILLAKTGEVTASNLNYQEWRSHSRSYEHRSSHSQQPVSLRLICSTDLHSLSCQFQTGTNCTALSQTQTADTYLHQGHLCEVNGSPSSHTPLSWGNILKSKTPLTPLQHTTPQHDPHFLMFWFIFIT